MRYIKYLIIFLLGFFIAKFWYEKQNKNYTEQETQLLINGIKNMSKLVVSQGSFSEILSYTDSKKYFYNYVSFDKKIVITVNAKVEVGYDLSKIAIEIDSIRKRIIINKIPKEEIVINPEVKYFDLEQSKFNSFTKRELNEINKKSIDKIKEGVPLAKLQSKAKLRLFEELSKIYQLSAIFDWQVVDNTDNNLIRQIKIKD